MNGTAQWGLPLLEAGQAQKEMAHNEALAALDLLVQPVVEAVGVDAPPVGALPGQCWVVGGAPVGDWAGQAGAIAGWTAAGWRFAAARVGAAVWSVADATQWRFDGEEWIEGRVSATALVVDGLPVVGARRSAVADPAGGGTVDAEARAAVAAVLAALRGHGLIAG